MPALDVTDILYDPDFAETLTVHRHAVTMGANGRSTRTRTVISPAPVGVVLSNSTENLIRDSDKEYRPKTIRIYTTFRLSSVSPGQEADIVVWNGDPYVVDKIDDYSRFGTGFVVADCISTDSIDNAPARAPRR